MTSKSSITYSFSGITRFWMYLGSLLFLFGGSVAIFQEFLVGLMFFGFAFLSIWMTIETSTKIITTNSGIRREKHFFTTKTVRWESIVGIIDNRILSRLEIQTDQNEKLYLPNQLDNFNVLVETLRKNRHDLFLVNGITQFHRSKFITYLMIVLGLIMLSFALFLPSDGDDFWARLILFGLALFCPFTLLFEIRELEIEEEYLKIKYPFRKKSLSAKDIAEISLSQEAGRYGARTILIFIIKLNGKKIKIGGFREGDLIVNEALQEWYSTNYS